MREVRPAAVEVPGFGKDFFLRERGDLEDIELRLRFRDLLVEGLCPRCKRVVLGAKSLLVNHPGLVEVVELVDLLGELATLAFKDGQEFGTLADRGIGALDMGGDFLGGEEEAAQLFVEDAVEVNDGDLVAAGVADILGCV